MKTKLTMIAALAGLLATPALAQEGDAEAGERVFNQCQACHVVEDDDGNVLAGRNGQVGPNLYGLPGRAAAAVEGFRYGDGIQAAAEQGMVWDEETFVAYLQDPTAYLREVTGDNRARSNMSYRVRSEEDAADVWAYIVSLSPEAAE